METNNYPRTWLDNIRSMNIPIYYITQCNARLLSEDSWSERFQPLAFSMREGCSKLMTYWKTKFKFPVENEMDYWKYKEYFYSDSDDEPDEEVLWNPIQVLLNKGLTQADIELYCAVVRFQYDKTLDLLNKGANPRASFDGSDAVDRIGAECAFLSTMVVPVWENYYDKKNFPINEQDLCDLIGWAAHEKMYDLLVSKSST